MSIEDFLHKLKCLANDNSGQAIQKRSLQKFWKKKGCEIKGGSHEMAAIHNIITLVMIVYYAMHSCQNLFCRLQCDT